MSAAQAVQKLEVCDEFISALRIKCEQSLPIEVTAKYIQLPLGVADDGVTHNRFLFLVLIIAGLILIRPHSGKTHKSACGRRARMRGSDDDNGDTNGNSGSGKQRNAQKRPTEAHSLHGYGVRQSSSGRNNI